MKQKSEGGQIWRGFKTEATMYPPFCFTPLLIHFLYQICHIPPIMPLDPLIPSVCSLHDPLLPPFSFLLFVSFFRFTATFFPPEQPYPLHCAPFHCSIRRINSVSPIVSSLKFSKPSPIYTLYKTRVTELIKFVVRGRVDVI